MKQYVGIAEVMSGKLKRSVLHIYRDIYWTSNSLHTLYDISLYFWIFFNIEKARIMFHVSFDLHIVPLKLLTLNERCWVKCYVTFILDQSMCTQFIFHLWYICLLSQNQTQNLTQKNRFKHCNKLFTVGRTNIDFILDWTTCQDVIFKYAMVL